VLYRTRARRRGVIERGLMRAFDKALTSLAMESRCMSSFVVVLNHRPEAELSQCWAAYTP